MWSDLMGLWVCKSAWKWNFPRSQKVKRSVSNTVFQKIKAYFPLDQQERDANRQLSHTNNSSVKPFWATQAPANRSTSLHSSADRSQRFQGQRNDYKDWSGMWSEGMGLWECKAACTWNLPRSQKVKGSVIRR